MFSDSRGDVAAGSTGGLVHEDTRFVSRWELRLDGAPLSLLKSGPVDYDSAAFFLTNPDTSRLRAHSVAVRRLRRVGGGALEQITAFNTSSEPIECELRLHCGADFADLFEIKSGARDRSASIAAAAVGPHSLRFRYQVPAFLAETTISVERSQIVDGATEEVLAASPPRVDGTDAVWKLELPPRCMFVALVKVRVRVNNVKFEPSAEGFGSRQQPVDGRPGVSGTARVDRRTGALVRRLRRGDIAVIDHLDLDRAHAQALVDAGVVAVVNASPFISGRYPNLGPDLLAKAGVLMLDNVGAEVFTAVSDGSDVRIDGDRLMRGEETLAVGQRLAAEDITERMEEARGGLATQLQSFTHNTTEFLRREQDLLLHGQGVPRLRAQIAGRRQVLTAQGEQQARLRDERHTAREVWADLKSFCDRTRSRLEEGTLADRQRILQLLIERVIVGDDTLEIRHVIPLRRPEPEGRIEGEGSL